MENKLKTMSNEELWQLFPIILEDYNILWPILYEKTKEKILVKLGSQIMRINHIGSTSVPGLKAKPTIDILIEVNDKFDHVKFVQAMTELGYLISHDQHEDKIEMMFLKGYTPQGFEGQVFHVHVRDADDWGELYFRDLLRKYEEICKRYVELKERLKDKFEHHRDNYTDAKTDFINQYTKIARTEFGNRYAIKK